MWEQDMSAGDQGKKKKTKMKEENYLERLWNNWIPALSNLQEGCIYILPCPYKI